MGNQRTDENLLLFETEYKKLTLAKQNRFLKIVRILETTITSYQNRLFHWGFRSKIPKKLTS